MPHHEPEHVLPGMHAPGRARERVLLVRLVRVVALRLRGSRVL